jgi:hypothetical protein
MGSAALVGTARGAVARRSWARRVVLFVVLLLCAPPSLTVRLTSDQRGQLWACKQLVCVVLILRMPWLGRVPVLWRSRAVLGANPTSSWPICVANPAH